MGPGRSPSRLRSKTADFSDYIRGNASPSKPSTDTMIPPVPPVPPLPEANTPRSKRKLTGFLGLKRKSAGIALGLEPGARELKDGVWRMEDPVPAIPDELLNSRIPPPQTLPAGASSLPSSLPPLNVSPPSFGTHFAPPSTSPSKAHLSATNPSQSDSDSPGPSSGKSAPFRTLRSQKSVSFEVSRPFNVAHNATASAMPSLVDKSKKPVITVSAPPVADDHDFSSPRAAPAPPSTSSSKSSGRFGFSFGHHHKKDEAKEKERVISHPITEEPLTPMQNRFASAAGSTPAEEKPSPTPSLSPIMRFPVPPNQEESTSEGEAQRDEEQLTSAFNHSPSSTLSPTVSPHTATPSDPTDRSPTPKPPTRPPRPSSLTLPSPGLSKRGPSTPTKATPTKIPSSPTSSTGGRSVGSLKIRSRRSRSPSPASPPPKDPLPSPPTSATFPSSDTEGWTTDASTTMCGWTTDASSRIGSIPSLTSRRSVAAARLRANTIAVVNASKSASGTMSSGDELEIRKSRGARPDLSHCMLGVIHGRHSRDSVKDDKPRERTRVDSHQHSQVPALPQTSGDTTPVREEMPAPAPSLRVAHETFVRMLREKHAAEKAELLKRIERLEKEARRRDREIKGLRWLIMNTNAEGGGARMPSMEDQLVVGRLRSESKASEFSAASSGRSRASSVVQPSASAERLREEQREREGSGRNSVEEGLKDLQDTVGDLIAPNVPQSPSPRGVETGIIRPDSPPDGAIRHSAGSSDIRAVKQSRRRSSPVLAGELTRPGGLGFDYIPSIPSVSSTCSDMSLVTAESISTPSLTTTNSVSSTLDVIPEAPATPSAERTTHERTPKEEKRSSRAYKRMSATASAHAAYAANLKVAMSPSIEQVLDRAGEIRDPGMDDVLRKLRAFGGSS